MHTFEENLILIWEKVQHEGKGSSKEKVCTYCGTLGHTMETCYHKHGFQLGSIYKGSDFVANNVGNE